MVLLPDKPSELIRVALADLEKVEKMRNVYSVNMGNWHLPEGDLCSVCLAGAVMAFTLGVPKNVEAWPGSLVIRDMDAKISNKLRAINDFRNGCVEDGVLQMDLPITEDVVHLDGEVCWTIPEYRADREGFFAKMRDLADRLEAIGL